MAEGIEEEHSKKELSFIDHLEALRWHIFRASIAILIGALLAFIFKPFVFDRLIFGPASPDFPTFKFLCSLSKKVSMGNAFCIEDFNFTFINVEMAGQFMVHLKVSLLLGFVIAFPYVFWEMWRFIAPGLHDSERKQTRGVVFFSTILFMAGVLFGYYVLMPFSINFFANYGVSDVVENSFKLTNYVSFITMFVMASGILFELPMVVYFLSKIGLLTPEFMRANRKQAWIVTLFIAAMITPADVGTQLLVTIPIIFLYEFSITICKRVSDQVARDLL